MCGRKYAQTVYWYQYIVLIRIEKAIRLSQEKYCGVALMMKKIGPITYDILLNGEPLKPQKHED